MSLELPDPAATAAFDVSCVGAVKVDVLGNDPGDGRSAQQIERCFDFLKGIRSFSDVGAALRGQFTFDVPSTGLASVELRGFSGRCSDPSSSTYESVFYGGAADNGGTKLQIPVNPGVSCNTTQNYQVRVLDLLGLYASPAGTTCVTPTDSLNLFAGVVRPRMLGDKQPRTIFEFGATSVPTADGMGTLRSYKPITSGKSCIAFSYRGVSAIGLACINLAAQAQGLCGMPNDTEVVALPIAALPTLPDPLATYGTLAVGAVWETSGTTKGPLRGATVTLDPSQGSVAYVDLAVQPGVSPARFQPLTPVAGATATTSGGGFVVYFKGEPTNLVVSAPGHATQTVRIASAPDVVATLIVPLAKL